MAQSVLIGGARIDENGNISGGSPGDQTGKEVATGNYYVHKLGWYVLRPKTEAIAALIAQNMFNACNNPNIGYSQSKRGTLLSTSKPNGYDCSKVTTKCDCDCSSLVRVCILFAGVDVGTFSTYDEKNVILATGCFTLLDNDMYCKSSDYLCKGDILVTRSKGHTEVVLTNGSKADSNYAQGNEYSDQSYSTAEMLNTLGALYDVEVTREDAVMREVGYFNTSYQPSIQSSKITLSVINYTNMLGELFSMYIPQNILSMHSNVHVNFDNVEGVVAKALLRGLVEANLNAAASCGVVANMFCESGLSTTYSSTSKCGICGWTGERRIQMQTLVGVDWSTDLTGQLAFMILEMKQKYIHVVDKLKAVPETREGAIQAAQIFMEYIGTTSDTNSRITQAEKYWSQLVIQQI